jgi:acetyl-CoA synthetase (ADP-forming)
VKNINVVFNPVSVAVVGASPDAGRVGYNILQSIVEGGFQGQVYPINSKYEQIMGLPCYSGLAELPVVPELVVLAVNQYVTVELVELCAHLGVKGVICSAGGFKEMGPEGQLLEKRLITVAEDAGIALVGPNTLGLINTAASLYATFYPMSLNRGSVSVISQSGGIGLSLLATMQDEGVGVGKWCGVGNRGVLEYADYLNYFAEDPETKVIGIFIEGTDKGREFIEAAAAVACRKPVVIFKAGRGEAAAQAARTHTGALAGSYRLYQDIFAQHRLLTVDSVEELVDMLKALSVVPQGAGGGSTEAIKGVGLITITAGPAIVVADILETAGCKLPELTAATLRRVEEAIGPNPPVILRNPLDLAGSGFAAPIYGQCAVALAADPEVDALLAIYCHHRNWSFPTSELIKVQTESRKPVVACYIGERESVAKERLRLHEAGIPLYHSVAAAAKGLVALKFYGGRE